MCASHRQRARKLQKSPRPLLPNSIHPRTHAGQDPLSLSLSGKWYVEGSGYQHVHDITPPAKELLAKKEEEEHEEDKDECKCCVCRQKVCVRPESISQKSPLCSPTDRFGRSYQSESTHRFGRPD